MRDLVVLLAAAGCGQLAGCTDDAGQQPVIDDVVPAIVAPGARIEILGDRFCGASDADAESDDSCLPPAPVALVTVAGDQFAAVEQHGHHRISATLPESAPSGATVVVVTRDGAPSNAFELQIQ